VTSCIGIATNQFGTDSKLGADLGTWQTGVLYTTYSLSAMFGATLVAKKLGSRNGVLCGMAIYVTYVTAFLIASVVEGNLRWYVAISGALVGGVGGGFLWTAQGKYFVSVSRAYAHSAGVPVESATSYLGGVFAFFYLYEEVLMKVLSTVITEFVDGSKAWVIVFAIYTAISVCACFGILLCHKFPVEEDDESKSIFYKLTCATRLLTSDPKMKYMIPLNAVFGATFGFMGAFVTGQVVHFSGKDVFVGEITAIPPAVAAVLSLVLGRVAQVTGKGPILVCGALSFAGFAASYLLFPGLEKGWVFLTVGYTLMGFGRATFESTLRATFADFFVEDTEGAFANIILQSGLASALAFFLFPHFTCETPTDYCVEYQDGTLHNVMTLEIVVMSIAGLAIVGYWKAAKIHEKDLSKQAYAALGSA
jgi:MFS family permease